MRTIYLIGLLGILTISLSCENTSSGGGESTTDKAPENPGAAKSEVKPSKTSPSEPTDKGEEKQPEEKPAGDSVTSAYTDLKEDACKTVDKNEDEAWSVQECPGIAGYKLEVAEGDLRQTINVISPSGKKSELNLWRVVSPAFSEVGAKAEWRIRKKDGKSVPFALIVRYNASENPNDSNKITSYLSVSKIDGDSSCVVGVVKPKRNANVAARKIADKALEMPCKKAA